jgi:hypothetical protein
LHFQFDIAAIRATLASIQDLREEVIVKWTNKYNLPENIKEAIKRNNDLYDKGKANRSVTQVIDHPRIDLLKKKHREDIVMDISESWWALFGSGVHYILELGKLSNQIAEERLFANVDGWILSGQLDMQTLRADEDGKTKIHISDYKVCASYSVIKDEREPKKEWVEQVNLQAFLIDENKDAEVESAEIVAIIRDWSRKKAEMDHLYPIAPVVSIPIPLWSKEERAEFARERINIHRQAEMDHELGFDLPECSSKDKWVNNERWAVMRKGLRRAVKVCDTEAEADAVLKIQEETNEKGHKFYIEHRPGENTRCKGNFCQVAQWCSQFAREQLMNGGRKATNATNEKPDTQ